MASKKTNGDGGDIARATEFRALATPTDEYRAVIAHNAGSLGFRSTDLDRVKVPAGGGTAWSLPSLDGEDAAREFDAIILEFGDGRRYWSKRYDGSKDPPDCISDDGITGHGDPGGQCRYCALSKFGTATSDDGEHGAGQACKEIRVLFLLRPEEIMPTVFVLPPTSGATCRRHFLRLGSRGIHFCHVVTRFGLERVKNSGGIDYSRVVMRSIQTLDPAAAARVDAIREALGPTIRAQKVDVGEVRGEV